MCAISGLENPERTDVRTKAMAMGAQYRPVWTGECTLLLAVFFNAPKVRQAILQGATVVHKVRFLTRSHMNSMQKRSTADSLQDMIPVAECRTGYRVRRMLMACALHSSPVADCRTGCTTATPPAASSRWNPTSCTPAGRTYPQKKKEKNSPPVGSPQCHRAAHLPCGRSRNERRGTQRHRRAHLPCGQSGSEQKSTQWRPRARLLYSPRQREQRSTCGCHKSHRPCGQRQREQRRTQGRLRPFFGCSQSRSLTCMWLRLITGQGRSQ